MLLAINGCNNHSKELYFKFSNISLLHYLQYFAVTLFSYSVHCFLTAVRLK